MNNEIQVIISKILRSKGFDSEPDALLFMINEIKNNTGLSKLYYENQNEYISKVSNNKFLGMVYDMYVNKTKESKKYADIQDDTHHLSTYPSQINHPPSISPPSSTPHHNESSGINIGIGSNIGIGTHTNVNLNSLPNIDDVYMYMYDLSLDLMNDLVVDDVEQLGIGKYQLQFTQYGNISKIKLISFSLPYNEYIKSLQYIYVKIDEVNGKCYDSKKNNFFGKLVFHSVSGDNMIYIPDYDSCVQVFSNAVNFNKLSLSYYEKNNKLINLQRIGLDEIKKTEEDYVLIRTEYKHNLKYLENIVLYVIHSDTDRINVHEVTVSKIVNDNEIIIESLSINDITSENVEMYRRNIKSNITFRMYELNNNLIYKKDKHDINLISLNNVINQLKNKVT